MLKKRPFRRFAFLLPVLMLMMPFEATAQVRVTQGKLLDGQARDLCQADKGAMRLWAEDGSDIEITFRALCNNEGGFVSPGDLVKAGWDEGVAAVVLGLAGFGSFGTKTLKVEIEGQEEGTQVWRQLGQKAYD